MRHHGVCIPNNMAAGRAFDDLDLSQDEVKRLGNALKDENFRKMLLEYAEEISDPENKRKAEEEIAMMEQERGMNIQFIHPEPGYVLKTSVDGSTKAFINICQNDKIEKPSSKRQVGPDGKSGLMWQIPHSFAPPRDDYDKSNNKCKVFDVVFHPDTYRMAMKNERFCKLVEDTAVDGIERQFSVSLDRKNLKHPKLKYKGTPTATVIRERLPDGEKKPLDPDNVLNQFSYPYDDKSSSERAKENASLTTKAATNGMPKTPQENNFTEPKYTITHRSEVDMSEYRNSPDAKTSTRPTELILKIELPLLKSAAQANLEIYERRLILESVAPAAYKLDLSLPYPINEEEGSAKFDKSKRTLTIVLPVIPSETPFIPFMQRAENENDFNGDVQAPLIQVLSEEVNGKSSGHLENQNLVGTELECGLVADTNACIKTNFKQKPKFPEHVKWQLPDYQFSQDNEIINFVIKVLNVDQESVDLTFLKPSVVIVRFLSIGAGVFPIYYCLTLEFPSTCMVSPDHSSIDASDDNLVLLLLKDRSSRGLWDTFKAGADLDHLEDKQFLTATNLQVELTRLGEEPKMPAQDETPELTVVEMSEEKLTIDIKPRKRRGKKGSKQRKDSGSSQEEEDDENAEYSDSAPSSAEIQVIHKHPTPKNLHGILKQRTVSESSEDQSIGQFDLPDSPRSDGEELHSSGSGISFRKQRSVSFNSHVDHTSFKSSASVSSMTPALKSKRKRQRKREERLKRSGRSNSEGGTSSSEDCSNKAQSLSEEEEEVGTEVNHRASLTRSVSDPGVGSTTSLSLISDKSEKEHEKSKADGFYTQGKKNEVELSEVELIAGSKKVLDFRTMKNLSCGNNAVTNGNCQQAALDKSVGGGDTGSIQSVVEDGEPGQEVVAKVVDKNKKIVAEIKSKLAGSSSGGGDGDSRSTEADDSDDDFVDAVSSMADDVAAKVNLAESREKGSGSVKVDDHQREKEEKVPSNPVDTMLSWQEGDNSIEHHTECAFQFTNSVMFDLDVD